MKTIQLCVEETLLAEVDRVTQALAMTREAFVLAALERALRQQEIIALEQKHARGYARHPITPGELGEWETEQAWSES